MPGKGQYGIIRAQLSYDNKPEYSNTAEAYENNNKTNFMKMIEVFIEGMAN